MRYCRYCGAPLREGSVFCSNCGRQLGHATQRRELPSGSNLRTDLPGQKLDNAIKAHRKKRGKRVLIPILLIASCCFIVATFALLLLKPRLQTGLTGEIHSGGGKAVASYINAALAETKQYDSMDAAVVEDILLDNLCCNVITSRADGAILSVSAPDMWDLIERTSADSESQTEFGKRLRDALEKGNYKTRTVTVEVTLDDAGNISDGYELVDAIYGGMFSKMDALLAEGDAVS